MCYFHTLERETDLKPYLLKISTLLTGEVNNLFQLLSTEHHSQDSLAPTSTKASVNSARTGQRVYPFCSVIIAQIYRMEAICLLCEEILPGLRGLKEVKGIVIPLPFATTFFGQSPHSAHVDIVCQEWCLTNESREIAIVVLIITHYGSAWPPEVFGKWLWAETQTQESGYYTEKEWKALWRVWYNAGIYQVWHNVGKQVAW